MKKGIILIPEEYNSSYIVAGRFYPLFNKIVNSLKWDLKVCDDIDSDIDILNYDVVMNFKSPEKNKPDVMKSLSTLPSSIKLISYFTDVHGNSDWNTGTNDQIYIDAMNSILSRSDKILCPYREFFMKKWNIYKDKFVLFPHFINSDFYENLEYISKPINKCIVSGAIHPVVYPTRTQITKSKSSFIDVLPSPGYKPIISSNCFIGDEYSKKLNQYLCGLSTCSIWNYVVNKYIEIPASWSLLIGKHCKDLDLYGFINKNNYLSFNTTEEFFDLVSDVVSNPLNYSNIRYNGRKFVLNNFTHHSSYDRFMNVLTNLWEE